MPSSEPLNKKSPWVLRHTRELTEYFTFLCPVYWITGLAVVAAGASLEWFTAAAAPLASLPLDVDSSGFSAPRGINRCVLFRELAKTYEALGV
jgi:hypothetical protein